jgi:hypothetical protein
MKKIITCITIMIIVLTEQTINAQMENCKKSPTL